MQWKPIKGTTVNAENFVGTLSANVDNEKFTDVEFRNFIRRSIPIVNGAMEPDEKT